MLYKRPIRNSIYIRFKLDDCWSFQNISIWRIGFKMFSIHDYTKQWYDFCYIENMLEKPQVVITCLIFHEPLFCQAVHSGKWEKQPQTMGIEWFNATNGNLSDKQIHWRQSENKIPTSFGVPQPLNDKEPQKYYRSRHLKTIFVVRACWYMAS